MIDNVFRGVVKAGTPIGLRLQPKRGTEPVRDVREIDFDRKVAVLSRRDEDGKLVVVTDRSGGKHLATQEVSAKGWTFVDLLTGAMVTL